MTKYPEPYGFVKSDKKTCPNCLKDPQENNLTNFNFDLPGRKPDIAEMAADVYQKRLKAEASQKRRELARSLWLILGLVFVVLLTLYPAHRKMTAKAEVAKPVPVTLDASQFSGLDSQKLVALMGKPFKRIAWKLQSSQGDFPAVTYIYGADQYEFMLIDDKVVRLTYYFYGLDNKGKAVKIPEPDKLFKQFAIEPSASMVQVGKAYYNLDYKKVSAKVPEVWIPFDDVNLKTMSMIFFIYDEKYFN